MSAIHALLALALALAVPPGEPRDGDRIAFVGGTLVEREQQSAYWETALIAARPDANVSFRNLGWSGDTVLGLSRARFGPPAEGLRLLLDHVAAVKPTLLIVNVGSVEAFAGPAGVAAFEKDLSVVLDAWSKHQPRVVLVAPPPMEALGPPLPEPTAYNGALPAYRDVLRNVAAKRGLGFADLASAFADAGGLVTDNGLHPTADGYRRTAKGWLRALGVTVPNWHVVVSADGKATTTEGTQVDQIAASPLRWRCRDATLPMGLRPLAVTGLSAGKHTLSIDGEKILEADAADWAAGVTLTQGPEFAQREKLRQAVIAKNTLYFHRYRPQNETYLFGFRKHEQGKNAAEVPQFEPLVERQDAVINALKRPIVHTYTLTPAGN